MKRLTQFPSVMHAPRRLNPLPLAIAALLAALVAAAPASGAMRAEKIAPHLCKVVGGGRFVDIPGFPGERIDRRLLPDIRWMVRNYDIFITDGYSTDPVHAANGEHPIGLAIDAVPDRSRGGTWKELGKLAHLAEPRRDEPIMPWRWVGWNGDPGHGRGDHLHLSWSHSPTEPRDPARVVYTRRCPDSPDSGDGTARGDGSGAGTGGVSSGDASDSSGAGGIGTSKVGAIAPAVPEDG